jgi:hypothetical protein
MLGADKYKVKPGMHDERLVCNGNSSSFDEIKTFHQICLEIFMKNVTQSLS